MNPSPESPPSAGARWRRVDLHLHTPGVHSFHPPAGSDPSTAAGLEGLADQYVDRLAAARVEIAALTDYQGVRVPWYEAIRDRAEARGIAVLPGAELSVGQGAGRGLHLLLICDPGRDPESVTRAIRHIDRQGRSLFSGRGEHTDVDLRDSPADALQYLRRELGCVVVAPHANDHNGLIRELGAQQAAELIGQGLIDAVDLCEDAPRRLAGTGVLSREQLDSLACTQSSDPKRLDEIGTKTLPDGRVRATWLKLSAVNAAAIRLALHDPASRVLTREPPAPDHPRIISLQVDGSGFLGDLTVAFNDDLSCLIGGRGAGKSAVLETLRYALGADPYSDASERVQLVEHALGSGGQVSIVIDRPGEQHGQRYEVSRVLGQRPRVTAGHGTNVEAVPMDLFGPQGRPMILLQREIQAVSRDEGFRLRLLNEIIGDDARRAEADVRRVIEDLRANARQITEADRRIAKLDDYQERKATLDTEIAYYEQQGLAEKYARESSLRGDGALVRGARERVLAAAEANEESSRDLRTSLEAAAEDLRRGSSEHRDLLDQLSARISDALRRIAAAQAQVEAQLQAALQDLKTEQDAWPGRVADVAEQIRQVITDAPGKTPDPERFLRAVEERTSLLPLIDSVTQTAARREDMAAERASLRRRLQDQRRQANTLRRKMAATVNARLDGTLRVSIDYLGDRAEFRRQLAALLRGSRVSTEAVDKIAGAPAVDGVELMRAVEAGPDEVVEAYGVTPNNAERLVGWLSDDPGRGFEVELLAPDDSVVIELDVEGQARPLDQLSSGQQATAILLLLFAQPGRPLILDQPEDDLDNRFVYEDVVTMLRAEKGVIEPSRRRQIVAATHNANIPVNGDAELVLSLSGEGNRCHVRARSSIDDASIRDEIRAVLEGGADAFRRRAEKYGGLDDA